MTEIEIKGLRMCDGTTVRMKAVRCPNCRAVLTIQEPDMRTVVEVRCICDARLTYDGEGVATMGRRTND